MRDTDSPGPLHGIRVLDLTSIVLGPVATQVLGDYGADVIKVEGPGGDLMRANGVAREPAMSSVFIGVNRNKRSIVLDLKAEAGREALLRLAARADVLVHNVRPKAMRGLRLAWEDLHAVNPRLIYCAATGFAQDGPQAGRPAFDDIVQAESGLVSLMQSVHGTPAYVPALLADKTAGLAVANAVLAALVHRERHGTGQAIEVPMFETMVEFNLLEHMGGRAFEPPLGGAGYARVTQGGRRPLRCADGYVAMLPYTPQQWARLLQEVGLGELVQRHALTDRASLNRCVRELYAELEAIAPRRSVAQWVETCRRLDVPIGAIRTLDELADHPQLRATGAFQTMPDGDGRKVRYVRPSARFSRTPARVRRAAPRLGQHTAEILAEAGYDAEAIGRLMRAGVAA